VFLSCQAAIANGKHQLPPPVRFFPKLWNELSYDLIVVEIDSPPISSKVLTLGCT
jgi:hypothetical protein